MQDWEKKEFNPTPVSIAFTDVHRYQRKPGWCGVACARMIMRAAGINSSQEEIAEEIYDPDLGTSHRELVKFLLEKFGRVVKQSGSSFKKIHELMSDGYLVIVNWMDDLPTEENDPPEGHYSLVSEIDLVRQKIRLLDPSNATRADGKTKRYGMDFTEFEERWYDYVDLEETQIIRGWLLAVDPESRLL